MGTLDEISNEIRILFAGSENDAVYRLESVGNEFPAFVVRFMGSYGVAIPYQGSEIAEEFANATLVSNELKIDGHNEQYLLLISSKKISRNEFAVFCALFVNPGKDGALRRDITENPVSWWQKWKQLIGNSITEKRPYAVLGELIIFMHLLNLGRSVNWEGANSNSHDLISPNEEFEVKSTTSRYEKVIHVTGQFQLQSNKKLLFLYFCRFEKNQNGFSIDDIVDRLSRDCGVSKDELNTKLFRIGYHIGSSARMEKYVILEVLKYSVDESFPKITPEMFKNETIPPGIKQLSYDVDLSLLSAEKVNITF